MTVDSIYALYISGLYYGITIAIVSLATAMTVLTLNIHHKGMRGKEVPIIVKKICFGLLSKILCLSLELPEYVNNKYTVCTILLHIKEL